MQLRPELWGYVALSLPSTPDTLSAEEQNETDMLRRRYAGKRAASSHSLLNDTQPDTRAARNPGTLDDLTQIFKTA